MPSPLIVIVGETASGKSTLALELAERFHGEIVCADSWTVYKEFDIGTAKPSAEELARVPHHLLNVADPAEGFSAAVFKGLAQKSIEDITSRGHLPFLVGGTGLYIDSVLYDYQFLPRPTDTQREELNSLTLPELLKMADELELDTDTIDTRNKRRIIRLIENNGRQPGKLPLRENTLILGLHIERDELAAKIESRVDTMLAHGLEQEVHVLAEKYGWAAEPMKGIGYREWQAYFAGLQDEETTRQQIMRSTTALAKKQRTWFKRNNSIQWLENRDKIAQSVDLITTQLNT